MAATSTFVALSLDLLQWWMCLRNTAADGHLVGENRWYTFTKLSATLSCDLILMPCFLSSDGVGATRRPRSDS